MSVNDSGTSDSGLNEREFWKMEGGRGGKKEKNREERRMGIYGFDRSEQERKAQAGWDLET